MSMPCRLPCIGLSSLLAVALNACSFPALADAQTPTKLSFVPADQGTFEFDTGVLRGRLRTQQLAFGLHGLERLPSGQKLVGTYGVMNVYRVFSDGRRYATAGWDWPSQAILHDDGSVTVECAAEASRPFVLRGRYRWSDSATVDLEIQVTPEKELHGFEVFVASYFDPVFSNSLAYVATGAQRSGQPGFLAAKESFGNWLMFPRDREAVTMIQDGRWKLPPNPVDWVIMPTLKRPLAVRRQRDGKLAALLMAHERDCFAVAMPHETEGHFSVYLSLFGRHLPAKEPATAHARLQILPAPTDQAILAAYDRFVNRLRK